MTNHQNPTRRNARQKIKGHIGSREDARPENELNCIMWKCNIRRETAGSRRRIHSHLFIYYVIRTKVHEKTKRRKCRKKQTKKDQRKHTKNISRKTHHMVHNWMYIWPRKPTGQCCLAISNKYTLEQQINLMQLSFSILRMPKQNEVL